MTTILVLYIGVMRVKEISDDFNVGNVGVMI